MEGDFSDTRAAGAADFYKDRDALVSAFRHVPYTIHFPLGCPKLVLLSCPVSSATEVHGSSLV